MLGRVGSTPGRWLSTVGSIVMLCRAHDPVRPFDQGAMIDARSPFAEALRRKLCNFGCETT
eukprot:4430046-Pyramimonas_sp.AAC.1